MKDQFCSYEISLKLKELGFDESCVAHYRDENSIVLLGHGISGLKYSWIENSNAILAPLYQQAISFLKSKDVLITELWDGWEYGKDGEDFTYAKILDEAIQKAIELIE